MKKRVAAAFLVVASILGFAVVATPAEAATQKICVYDNNMGGVDTTGNSVGSGQCKTVNRYWLVKVKGASYRVKYNSGSYSECRGNVQTWFDAYNPPDKITFKIYNARNCQYSL